MATQYKLTTEELVLRVEPTAHIHDDGGLVYVHIKRDRTVACECCGRTHRCPTTQPNPIGAGDSNSNAWLDAAKRLKLVK